MVFMKYSERNPNAARKHRIWIWIQISLCLDKCKVVRDDQTFR